MGAPWTPGYACSHLGCLEEEVVYASPMYLSHVRLWLRYIDDVLMLWEGPDEDLSLFMDELNNNSRNIRLTFTADAHDISFLDLLIRLGNSYLSTQTFRKSMAANTLLHASSHHPKSLIRGIPIGQFQRIRRNCSNELDYKQDAKEIYQRFRERGYSHRNLRRAKRLASSKCRNYLIKPRTIPRTTREGPVRTITKFGAQRSILNRILKEQWHILTRSVDLRDTV